jgi:dipeptidyl-peptidase 4
MKTSDEAAHMAQRYGKALSLTAPKSAAHRVGFAVSGYWLDDSRYYFLADILEPSLGRVVSVPTIADVVTKRITEVMSLEALVALLRDRSDPPVDLETLSCAAFDMPDRDTLAVTVAGHEYLIETHEPRVVKAREARERPALYSPDGRFACFVKGYDLWLEDRQTGRERALTTDGSVHHAYGQLSEAGLAAVTYRKRQAPVGVWAPDSQWFLTRRIDERSLPEMGLIEHAPPGHGRPVMHAFKYVIPGDPLPQATYVAIHVASGRTVVFDEFTAPVVAPWARRMDAWFSGKDQAWFLRIDRYAKRAELIALDLARGTGRVVLDETAPSGYLDLHPLGQAPNVRTLERTDEIIWFSEADGWGHLYLYDGRGKLTNRITRGEWVVRDIVQVDEARRRVLFLAGGVDAGSDPARRSLCAANLDGSGVEVLIAHDGDVFLPHTELCGLGQDRPFRPSHASPGVSPGGAFGVVRYTTIERGNRTDLVNLRTGESLPIASMRPAMHEVMPRHFSALAADGVTRLYGVLFFPSDFDPRRQYPLIDYIYPGPQIAHEPQAFGSMSTAQASALAELGFVTLMLDTRGMPLRSRALHQMGYGELLEPQLADHAAVVRQLCERHAFIDGSRIGIIGQSGGGAAAARALLEYGDLFKVGVSVCGNHDSSVYCSPWSDKYRGPGDCASWHEQANTALAHRLQGKLLLISGDMDENVLVSQTFLLVDALVRANRDFELLIVPNEGHGVLLTSGYAQRRSWDFFVRHLLGQMPPRNFEIRFEPYELTRCLERFSLELS